MDKSRDDSTDKEVESEEENFKRVFLLNMAEIICYVPLLEELYNSSYVGRDKYTNSQAGTFNLLICRSGKIQVISG